MIEGHQTRHDPHRGRYFKPQRLHADKAYDRADLRKWPRWRRIGVRIARKGIESSERLGHRRWVIERTMSWLSGYRRLSPRYERHPRNYLAFLGRRRPLLLQAPRPPHHVGHGLRSHLIWLGRLPAVATIVERLVPDEVVGAVPACGSGGAVAAPGRRLASARRPRGAARDRFRGGLGLHVVAVADRVVRAVGATVHRRFTEWTKARGWAKLHRLVLDELRSRGELDWSRCAIDSVHMRALKGGADRSESCRPWQVRAKDPFDHGAGQATPVRWSRGCQHTRQPGADPAGEGHSSDPLPSRAPAAQAPQTPRRQRL